MSKLKYFDNLYLNSMKLNIKERKPAGLGLQSSSISGDSISQEHHHPIRFDLPALLKEKELPRNSMILTRHFIHNSLYNPFYGYFSVHAQVLENDQKKQLLDFKRIKNNDDFLWRLANLYSDIDNDHSSKHLQLWHTPTEIFQPFYGYAIAKYITKQFKEKKGCFGGINSEKVKIIEIGAGNGTLMKNIMTYFRLYEPDLFKNMKYEIIEISPQLAKAQKKAVSELPLHTQHKVTITNKSIFDYTRNSSEPCFFIAMEVLDNLSHDLIRFDTNTGEPVQGMVFVDESGDFEQVYESMSDQSLMRYLQTRNKIDYQSPVFGNSLLSQALSFLNPLKANLSPQEFIPTNAFLLLEKIFECFPNHHLLMSDFHYLPDTIEGIDAPVVQTRYQRKMVPCSTYLVDPGYFDIFFPTNFELMANIYAQLELKHRPNSKSKAKTLFISSHKDFLANNSQVLHYTQTASGENPMLEYYENVSFLTS